MILNEFFRPKKTIPIFEGGNLELPNPNDPAAPYQADEIDLKVHNRSFMVGLLDKLLNDINGAFYSKYKKPLWNPNLLQSKQFLGGSSLHFFNTSGISDKEFTKHKPKVGDIDTQCNKELEPEIRDFLTTYDHKQVGDTTLLGFSQGSEQLNALFQFQDPPIKIQIDFEFGQYDAETDMPDEWYRFSHSSEWNDVQAGIKGVFHKWLYRALTSAHSSIKHQVDVKKTKTNIKPNVADNDLSFAVASGQGGGLSQKYEPYIHTDPTTGEKKTHQDNVPYKRLIPSAERTYIQKLDQQFYYFFGAKPEGNDKELQKSFLGTLELINKYITDQDAKEKVFMALLNLCFEPGVGQMITKNDPERDQEIKFAAIDNFIKICKLKNVRKTAIDMGKAYMDEFSEVQAYKKKHPEEKQPRAALKRLKAGGQLNEAEVKSQLRKGMPHLHDLKPADFLDLLDELHDGNGNFKLQNIPLNVKVDGFGGRFGKNSEGNPFMGTSRTEPRYTAGFLDYHQKKGTQDPDILGRAKKFDDLFNEMMNAVQLVDSKLGADFLVNKQVTCEVLFLPFAIPQDDGRLKYVGIAYDELPKGVQLALVPFRVVDATTGEDLPDADSIVKELTGLGQQGSVMFIDNSLTQNEALDVTALVPPLDNIEALKKIVSDTAGKRDRASLELRREVEAELLPIKERLEAAIIKDPNIVGKDMLGQDYEGIVINSRLGPIKVTSQEQRNVIQAKNDAKVNARTERPRGENKTAVVAIGSFVGHIGHEQLFDYTIKKAQQLGGDPYLFIGNGEGKDDPIPPAVKVQTWHKMYPQYANSISTVTQQGGTLMQKIKHELINPLPNNPPRYDNIVIMVGEDQANMPIANALMKAVNKFQGYEHVKVSLEVTPRGTGMSFTKLRNILKDPNATPEQQYAEWAKGFDEKKLGKDWILHLMDITRKGMGIQTMKQQPVVAERLFNALIRPTVNETSRMSSAVKLQRAWEREQAKSTASRKRGEEYMNQIKQDVANKKPDAPKEIEDESIMGFLATPKQPTTKKSTTSAGEMRRYFEKEKAKDPEKTERGDGSKKAQQVYTRSEMEEGDSGAKYKVRSIGKDKKGEYYISPSTGEKVYKKAKVGDHEVPGSKEIKPKVEAMMPASNFAGSKKNKLGTAGQLKATAKHAKQGDLVGGAAEDIKNEEKQRLDPKCWKGYKKQGTKMKGGVRVNNCVPVSEDIENKMASLITLLENK